MSLSSIGKVKVPLCLVCSGCDSFLWFLWLYSDTALRFFVMQWHDQLCDKCLRSSAKQKCWCFLNLTNSYIKWEVCSSFHSFHWVSLLLLFGLKQKLAYKYLSLLLWLFFIISSTHLLGAAELGVKHPTNKTWGSFIWKRTLCTLDMIHLYA